MRSPALKKIGKRVLQIGLPIAILLFFANQVHQTWNGLTSHSFQWNPWLLTLSFLCFILQELSFGVIWQTVLARIGYRVDFRVSLRIYLASEFVRYIPGNVWHVLTRILWVGKYGVPRPIAFASMTIELITKLASGALIFAISLLFWHNVAAVGSLFQSPLIPTLAGVTILALLVLLHPRVLNGLLNVALRVLKRDPVVLTLRYSDILLVTLMWCLSWIIAGSAFYFLLLALRPDTTLAMLPICIGIYAIAWDVGFVAFITPSGLGFREGAIGGLFLLALPFPAAIGAIMALLSRFVSTMAELLCVGAAYLSGERQICEVQQEQSSQTPVSKDQAEDTMNNESIAPVSVEGGAGSE